MKKYCFLICLIMAACQLDTANNKVIESSSTYYSEPHRAQFHFSPEANWMNDPNGMVYYEGEYHLFYQYYPDSTVWGPMHWGHAISKDLVNWEHLDIALYPDSLGYIFSGSAIVDFNNDSGLGTKDAPAMIAFFTHHDIIGERTGELDFQYQSLAYSLDKGRSWTKYAKNPVIDNPGIKDFRDPKVVWHDATKRWAMVFAAYDKVMIYTSSDLLEWEYSSEFGIEGDDRLWECPDLFPMQLKDSDETKWVLIVSIQKEAPNGGTATSYFVGDFDGKEFTDDTEDQKWLDWGKDNYAFVSWSGIPESDGRRIGIGWMSNWQYAQVVPTENWRSAMTLPRELVLDTIDGAYILRSFAVKELEALETKELHSSVELKPDGDLSLHSNTGLYKLQLTMNPLLEGKVGIELYNDNSERIDISINIDERIVSIDRRESGATSFNDDFASELHKASLIQEELSDVILFVDHSSIELFINEGSTVMTEIFFSEEPLNSIRISGLSMQELDKLTHTELRSIWQTY